MNASVRILCTVIGLSLAAAMLGGCSGEPDETATPQPADQQTVAAPAEYTAQQLSYRHDPLDADSTTPGATTSGGDPGDNATLARSFENAPPLIPHAIDDFVPITARENSCYECHNRDDAADMGATPVPDSHLYDIRRDRQLGGLNPANYHCTQCHVALTDASILVDNEFAPDFRSDTSDSASDLLQRLNEGVE